MRPRELPAHLVSQPFRRIDALAAGVTEDRLRAKDLDRSVRGVRSQSPVEGLAERCRLFATRLRQDVVFSHLTAARILNAPVPTYAEHDEILDVTVPAPEPAPHARGLRGHSRALLDSEVVTVRGLRITSPARTWCDLASMLSLSDLVAVGDFLVAWRSPLVGIVELDGFVRLRGGQRGARRARRALELLDARAESAPESRLRVILVEAGLPVPEVNYPVRVGGRDYRVDLAYPDLKVAIEYQGDYHRDRVQWRRDMTRRSHLESDDWAMIEVNADDVRHPRELAGRIQSVLARR